MTFVKKGARRRLSGVLAVTGVSMLYPNFGARRLWVAYKEKREQEHRKEMFAEETAEADDL